MDVFPARLFNLSLFLRPLRQLEALVERSRGRTTSTRRRRRRRRVGNARRPEAGRRFNESGSVVGGWGGGFVADYTVFRALATTVGTGVWRLRLT